MKTQINQRLASRNIELVGEYTNAKTKTTFIDHTCGHTWEVAPDGVMQGTGCPHCKNRKLIHGVGDNDLRFSSDHPIYIIWHSMLSRCYSSKVKTRQPEYEKASCHSTWHTLSNFVEWVGQQDWEGKQLDKDLLFLGNKEYGPTTCVFISSQVNNLIQERKKRTVDLPRGVHRTGKKFFAEFNKEYLGSFDTTEAAHTAYGQRRNIALMLAAGQQTDPRIKEAILNRRS